MGTSRWKRNLHTVGTAMWFFGLAEAHSTCRILQQTLTSLGSVHLPISLSEQTIVQTSHCCCHWSPSTSVIIGRHWGSSWRLTRLWAEEQHHSQLHTRQCTLSAS